MSDNHITIEPIKLDIFHLCLCSDEKDFVRKQKDHPTTYDHYFDYLYRDVGNNAPDIVRLCQDNFNEWAYDIIKGIMVLEGRFISVVRNEHSTCISRDKTTLKQAFDWLNARPWRGGFIVGVVVIDEETCFGFKIDNTVLKYVIESETWDEYRVCSFFEGQSFVS